jgi:hypothetical protein
MENDSHISKFRTRSCSQKDSPMSTSEIRSLDRFMTARGAALAGVVDDTERIRIMGIVGSVYGIAGALQTGIGAALAIGGNPNPVPGLFFVGGVLLATSGLLAGIRNSFKRRMQQQPQTVEATPEAKALMQKLLTHLHGMPFSHKFRRRRYRRLMAQEIISLPKDARSKDVLRAETFALLESAAQEANRIYGMVEQTEGEADSSVKQMAPSILAAADEAMATLFHTAAQIEKFPESSAAVQAEAESQIAELRELAEQMEEICAAAEPSVSSSRLQTVREALRAELRAREELNAPTVPMNTPEVALPAYAPPAQQVEEQQQVMVHRSS